MKKRKRKANEKRGKKQEKMALISKQCVRYALKNFKTYFLSPTSKEKKTHTKTHKKCLHFLNYYNLLLPSQKTRWALRK